MEQRCAHADTAGVERGERTGVVKADPRETQATGTAPDRHQRCPPLRRDQAEGRDRFEVGFEDASKQLAVAGEVRRERSPRGGVEIEAVSIGEDLVMGVDGQAAVCPGAGSLLEFPRMASARPRRNSASSAGMASMFSNTLSRRAGE